ncbi:MAG TPA: glycosyl transferase family 2 [Acidobacteria bacterium]|nr:glycosyl transferase family 2 [Acidobacteriota bacterium]
MKLDPNLLLPVFFWALLFLFFCKIPLARKHSQRQGQRWPECDPPAIPGLPSISIIIPARNEEPNLKLLLDSLARQSLKPHEIIVVDDNSSDGTARVAREKGARLVSLPALPEGWTGKALACFTGARAASADLLVFLDADTVLEDDGLEVLCRLYQKTGGLVSVQPYHRMEKPYEKLSAFFNLILFLNMNISSCIPGLNSPRGAFGPCFICSRADYFALGGHEAIKAEIIEDMALARLARKKGYSVSCFAGRGLITFRMYPGGLNHLIEGWTKNFATGAVKTGPWLFLVTFGWVTGAMSGPVDIVQGLVAGQHLLFQTGVILYLLFLAQIYFFLQPLGNFGLVSVILYPFSLAFFIFIFLRSMVYTHLLGYVHWKGRRIKLRPDKQKGRSR